MRKLILIFLFSFVTFSFSLAQKEKYQSLFIYNFTKYIKWPENYVAEKFVIGIIGNSKIIDDLNEMAITKKKTANGAEIEVKKYSSPEEVGECHILFVSENMVDRFPLIDVRTSGKPILLITDSPGMGAKGSIINFVERDGKIKFELNESSATKRNLVISGSLTSLAILI